MVFFALGKIGLYSAPLLKLWLILTRYFNLEIVSKLLGYYVQKNQGRGDPVFWVERFNYLSLCL